MDERNQKMPPFGGPQGGPQGGPPMGGPGGPRMGKPPKFEDEGKPAAPVCETNAPEKKG